MIFGVPGIILLPRPGRLLRGSAFQGPSKWENINMKMSCKKMGWLIKRKIGGRAYKIQFRNVGPCKYGKFEVGII